jgi:Leucine-rich repeat (LRR) protein
MPLRELRLSGTSHPSHPTDLSPLAHSLALEKLSLPEGTHDLTFLTTLPKLQQVEFHKDGSPEKWQSPHDFLATHGPEVPEIKAARAALAKAGLKDLPIWRIVVDSDHLLFLDLHDLPLTDLSPLRGLPVKQLLLKNTQVRDLAPLRGMQLTVLAIYSTQVDDLEPLRGMPLRDLALSGAKVRRIEPLQGMPLVTLHLNDTLVADVAPLADFRELEDVMVPAGAANIERLRALPKLRYISYGEWDIKNNRAAQTAEEFWRKFDAQKAGK